MARFINDRKASKGQIPGSLILIGKQKMEKPVIRLMEYNLDHLVEEELSGMEEAVTIHDPGTVSWINIYGIHDQDLMGRLGEKFGLHSLFLEDVMNTDQRPKYEDGENFDAVILKMLKYDESTKLISAEQFTMILGKHFVLTLQEQTGDVFDPVRERIRNAKATSRLYDADYLAYALLDTIVDNYIQVTEAIGREIESLEDRIFLNPEKSLVEEIYKFKTELSFLRKSVRPVKDLTGQLMKSENTLFQEKHLHFLKDLDDLVIQATEAIELYNGMISDHLNIYSTNVNNRINEVMKVLTIFASIFIPLTFLAGIYGMNFQYLPELGFKYSYLIFWIVVVSVVTGLLLYFKRKKWL
ncbi:MAG: magnesium/cobalt transporter CorA [Bacteroidia bacterium]|nr:MAG: magnesium/cobalt transporter CorA [Bacteroidia bacterium]